MFSATKGFAVPDDYKCRQFPAGAWPTRRRRRRCVTPRSDARAMSTRAADDNMLHTLIVGLILAAVAIPFKMIIGELLAQGSEPDFPERQLSWPILYRLTMGKQRWRFDDTRPGYFKVLLARFAHEKMKIWLTMGEDLWEALGTLPERLRRCFSRGGGDGGKRSGRHSGHHHRGHAPGGGKEGGAGPDDQEVGGGEREAYEAGRHHARERTVKKYKGIVLIYVAWGVMAWIVFACAPAPPLYCGRTCVLAARAEATRALTPLDASSPLARQTAASSTSSSGKGRRSSLPAGG